MNKNINEEAESVNFSKYPNVKFTDKVVGKSTPSKDKINPSLLSDVEKAAKLAGVTPHITTAVSGHKKKGRHPQGNAVDIAMINGKAVSLANRSDADKLVNALISMGYTKNSESGNDKAVLTFGFPAHDNHVHVSRKSGGGTSFVNQDTFDDLNSKNTESPSSDTNNNSSDDDKLSGDYDFTEKDLQSILGGAIKKIFPGLHEELERINQINESLTNGSKIGPFSVISDVKGHGGRKLGNWQSDNAWDLKAPVGTPVYSYTDGTVTKVYQSPPGSAKIFGTQISISGDGDYPDIFYTHLEGSPLKKGQKIKVGDLVGKITNWTTHPDQSHVHVGLKKGDLGDLISRNPNLNSGLSTSSTPSNNDDNELEDKHGDYSFTTQDLNKIISGSILKTVPGLHEELERIKKIMK